jgi:DNA-binding GntR family transcriptional regulator
MPLPTSHRAIDRRSARAAVYEQLRTWIEDGVLEPGETLKDAEIAELLGVSRTPAREALQMLEQIGVVEMQPGKLTRVTPIALDDVTQLYMPLGALHAVAAQLGTPRATERDLDSMRRHNAALLAAVDAADPAAARDADRDFHAVLLRLADNPYLNTAIEPLLIHARRLEALYFREVAPAHASHAEHERIIAAVAAGDVDAAQRLVRANLARYYTPDA